MLTKFPNVAQPSWLHYFNVDDIGAVAKQVNAGGGRILQGPIELLDARATPPDWFCYTSVAGKRQEFDFACEEIAAISMDRHHAEKPLVQTIIMHRTGSQPWQIAKRQP